MAHSKLAQGTGPRPRAATFSRSPATAIGLGLLLGHLVLSPLLFSSSTVGAFEFPKLLLLTLTAILLGALGIGALVGPRSPLGGRGDWARPFALWRTPLLLGFVLFLLSAVVSTLASLSPLTSLLGTHESHAGLCTIAACTVLFVATRGLCRNVSDARLLLGGCVVAAAAASTYALLQVAGLDPLAWAGLSSVGNYLRPLGPLGHPNFLAAYLVMTLPLTVYFARRAAAQRHWLALAVLTLVGLTSGLTVALAVSRAAWLALACALLVLLAGTVCARHWRAAAALALLPVGGGVLLAGLLAFGGDHPLLTTLRQRLERLGDAASREHIWQAGLAIFQDHPLLGCGPDAFQLAFGARRTAAYWQVEWNLTPARAHNEAIHVLATQGLLGGAALLVLLAGLGYAGVRAWRRASPDARPLLLAVLAGTVGFLVQNAFGFTVVACGALFATFAGLLSRFGEAAPEAVPELPLTRCRWSLVGLSCAGVLVILAFAHEFIGPTRDGVQAAIAGAALLAALGATGWALLRVAATGNPAVLPKTAPVPLEASALGLGWRRAVQFAAWVGAAALVFVGVLQPLHANVLCCTAEHLFQADGRQAVELFARAALEDPARELYWSKLGGAAQVTALKVPNPEERCGLFRLAHTALQRASALSPQNAYHHANLGQLLGRMARAGCADAWDAYAAFDRALALDGQNVNFHADAADAALGVRDWGKARAYAARGTELYPRYARTRAQLGYLALIERRHVDAVNLLCEAMHCEWHEELSARVIALANLATAYVNLRLYEAAIDADRQALALAPHAAEVRYNLGGALEMMGRGAEAAAEYRQVLEQAPGHRGAFAGVTRLNGIPVAAPERRW